MTASQARDANIRHETIAKFTKGMTQEQVTQAMGPPQEFRAGNGARDDVAIYHVDRETFTLYFYQGRLTRMVSSKLPVNR